MLRFLGFAIPIYVTWKQGVRNSHPGPGICAGCGVARARTYARHDEKPYCADCIQLLLDAAVPDPAEQQRHPDTMPVEILYERMKAAGGTDDFELRAVAAGPHPDPRMYDRTLT